ncbi:MAG: L,D-transpeptidase family protein [Verrucomicrobiota bacterium]
MSHRPHYRLPAESRGAGGIFFWLFAGLVIGIIGFVWWTSSKPKPKPVAPEQRPVVITTNVTSAPPRVIAAAPVTPPSSNRPVAILPAAVTTNRVIAPIPVSTNKPALVPPVVSPAPKSSTTNGFPRPPRDTLEAQIVLARLAISSGSIDGVNGSQTRAALLAFQREKGLSPTGELDVATRKALVMEEPPLVSYVITSNDLARLQPISKTWLGKSRQSALDYETILELVAEKGHASPTLTRKLNPGVDWTNLVAGTEVKIPAVEYPAPKTKAAFVVISLAERRLQAFDAETNLLAHFPCSIAAKFEKRPVGELHVKAVAPNPDYTFNPEVFPESEEAQQLKTKLILPPGPNNPVGTAWISLDRPGYGMHGTPSPEQVGRTESHGCFRLANWNAEHLIKLVWVGMPVWVEP